MSTRTSSSGSTVFIVLLLIFTFPIWIGLAGGLVGILAGVFGAIIGVIAGIFGALFGVIGAVFGAIFGAIGSVFGAIFGVFDWNSYGIFDWFSYPYVFGVRFFLIVAMVFAVVLLINSKKRKK
jgi:hypothetical protein